MAARKLICIAGAGIAGLTLALALAKFGASVVVIERSSAPETAGAGIQIGPNARKVLDRLGVGEAVAARAFEPDGIDVYPYRAEQPLVTLALGEAMRERFGAPYSVMHRADLADLLLRACKRFANIDLLFGVRASHVEVQPGGVTLTVDEADGKSRHITAFAFVGADGVHSPTRTQLLDGPAARDSGLVAWRALLPLESTPNGLSRDRLSLLMSPGAHAVCYPLQARDGFNVVLLGADNRVDATAPDPARLARLPLLYGAADWDWSRWPIFTVETRHWFAGSMGLVGDAAHAMLPSQAQGAAMAIEDAAVLAPLLMGAPNAATAFRRYAELRRGRVARVRRASARNASAFHIGWPLSAARDLVLRLGGPRGQLRRLDWLYRGGPGNLKDETTVG